MNSLSDRSYLLRVRSICLGEPIDLSIFLETAVESMLVDSIFQNSEPWLFYNLSWRIVLEFEDGYWLTIHKDHELVASSANGGASISKPESKYGFNWNWSTSADGWRSTYSFEKFQAVMDFVESLMSVHGKFKVVLPWEEDLKRIILEGEVDSEKINDGNASKVFLGLLPKIVSKNEFAFQVEICDGSGYLSKKCALGRLDDFMDQLIKDGWECMFGTWEDARQEFDRPLLIFYIENNGHCSSSAGDFDYFDDTGALIQDLEDFQVQYLVDQAKNYGFNLEIDEEFVRFASV